MLLMNVHYFFLTYFIFFTTITFFTGEYRLAGLDIEIELLWKKIFFWENFPHHV